MPIEATAEFSHRRQVGETRQTFGDRLIKRNPAVLQINHPLRKGQHPLQTMLSQDDSQPQLFVEAP